MTLGQKLKALLKESGMTQEDLAERLEVSRQAVGKWVNDKGIPEVAKLVQISDLFDVSLDYLLKEDCTEKNTQNAAEADVSRQAARNSGYYVSKEMLDGYLSYSRQRVRQITTGIGLFFFSNVFDCFGSENKILSMLYWLTMITGVCMIIAAVIILFAGSEMDMFFRNELELEMAVGNALSWIADTIWIVLMVWAGMSMHVDSVIIQNAQHAQKSAPEKRYRWVYAALPVTALAVLIGFLTNVWRPYAPILILFCCLLVTTCKLLIEKEEKR